MSLPKATIVSMPAEKPRPVGELVPSLLDLIEEGEIELAVSRLPALTAVELGPDATRDDRVRLAQTTELLGVAKKLPVPVARALAAGIREGSFASIKPRLEVYAQSNYGRAIKARRVLYRHAPSLATAVSIWLAAPIPRAHDEPTHTRRSAGSAAGLISAMLMMGVAGSRCAVSTSHHEFSAPRLDLQPIKLMSEVQFDPALYNRVGPPTFHGEHSRGLQLAEIQLSASKIMQLGSIQQVAAADALSLAASRSSCTEIRAAATRLGYASVPTVSTFDPVIAEHVMAIDERLDAVCPR